MFAPAEARKRRLRELDDIFGGLDDARRPAPPPVTAPECAAITAESLTSGREMSERGLTEGEDGETLSDELAPECTPALHETVMDEDVKAVRVPLSRAA